MHLIVNFSCWKLIKVAIHYAVFNKYPYWWFTAVNSTKSKSVLTDLGTSFRGRLNVIITVLFIKTATIRTQPPCITKTKQLASSSFTLYLAAVGAHWSLLGSIRNGQAALYPRQKHKLCLQHIRSFNHCGCILNWQKKDSWRVRSASPRNSSPLRPTLTRSK